MSSNKLVFTVLMSLSLFSLTACKQGGDSSRTTIRKGNQPNQVKPNAQKQADEQRQKDANTKTAEDNRTRRDTPQPDGADQNKVTPDEKCSDLEASAKNNGWKIQSIGEGTNKIVYYVIEKSIDNFTNPVIYFNSNAFQKVTTDDLKTFKDRYDNLKIDPILMDMRGAGCSSALPDLQKNTAELNKYGSRFAVQDAEAIRKKLLHDKQWKIMAHGTGGAVALRYVQLAPTSVESIHIADFAPVKNQTTLMKIRTKQELDSLNKLMQEHKLTEADIEKARKNLGTDKNLIDVLAVDLSYKNKWESIANTIKALADGSKKADSLKEILANLKKKSDLDTAARILDLDPSKNLAACSEALKAGGDGTISSCRLEKLVGHGTYSNIKNLVNHDALNMDIIKANITKHNITYHLFSGKLSTAYPTSAYEEHEKAMGDILNEQQSLNMGSEISSSEEFLETLK